MHDQPDVTCHLALCLITRKPWIAIAEEMRQRCEPYAGACCSSLIFQVAGAQHDLALSRN
jgi:hypothetical protein